MELAPRNMGRHHQQGLCPAPHHWNGPKAARSPAWLDGWALCDCRKRTDFCLGICGRRARAEITVGDVSSYVPEDHRWYRAEDIPVPVDSA
jgi:hypothetical protein